MNQKASSLIALLLIPWVISSNILGVFACGPFYDEAVFVSWNHPDLPLRNFAAGNLGVIQQGWARSYLCVAYRYLTAQGLNKTEQASIEHLWDDRLVQESQLSGAYDADPMRSYIDLRDKVLKIKPDDSWTIFSKLSQFSNDNNIGANSFVEAQKVLKARIKDYGHSSREVHEWIKGQDCVFGLTPEGKRIVPALLGNGFDETLKEDRLYQRAAATFYLRDYEKAAKIFKQILNNKRSVRHGLVSYMVARCRANASLCAGPAESTSQVISSIEKTAQAETDLKQKQNFIDLICLLKSGQLSRDENFVRLVRATSRRTSEPLAAESFGRNVGDLTYMLTMANADDLGGDSGQQAPLKVMDYDLTAWLTTISDGYDPFADTEEELAERLRDFPDSSGWIKEEQKHLAKHQSILKERSAYALSQWKKHHKLHWLVAVMLCGGLRPTERADALSAAAKIGPQSPAYQTATFFVVDALMAKGDMDGARGKLAAILSDKHCLLPMSAANLFKSQKLGLSTNVDEYLTAACMTLIPSAESSVLLPSDWWHYEKNAKSYPVLGGWDAEVARDLDYNLPFSFWLKLARRSDLPANLHARIVCAVWLRSILLGRTKDTDLLTREMARAYPAFAPRLIKYRNTPPGREKQFILASLILDNYGMAPYVRSGLPRFAMPMDQFNYYQKNFWLPLKPNGKNMGSDRNEWGSVVSRGGSPDWDVNR